jgi:hypothetical protein
MEWTYSVKERYIPDGEQIPSCDGTEGRGLIKVEHGLPKGEATAGRPQCQSSPVLTSFLPRPRLQLIDSDIQCLPAWRPMY